MSALDLLVADRFLLEAGSVSTAQGLYDFLTSSKEVRNLRDEIKQESIGQSEIETFVREVLTHLKPGQRFSYDASLAALTVALDFSPRDFVSNLVDALAALHLREMPLASRVASLVKVYREKHLVKQTVRTFEIERPITAYPRFKFAPPVAAYGLTVVLCGKLARYYRSHSSSNSSFNSDNFLQIEPHAA